MEASDDSPVFYDVETEQYSGFFNNAVGYEHLHKVAKKKWKLSGYI